MRDFSNRSLEIEMMDDLDASGEIIDITLKELETINLLLGGNYVTINGIKKLLYGFKSEAPIVVADLGCGSGDILRLMRKTLRKSGVEAQLIGIDANPNISDYANSHTPAEDQIKYYPLNIFSEDFKNKKFDIVTGTLFFHHFSNKKLIEFFRELKDQVRIGIIINDIHRHWFAYYSIKWITHLFSKSSMVKNDAAVSVLRAFRKKELTKILDVAGFSRYSIKWMWAFRWQVIIDLKK